MTLEMWNEWSFTQGVAKCCETRVLARFDIFHPTSTDRRHTLPSFLLLLFLCTTSVEEEEEEEEEKKTKEPFDREVERLFSSLSYFRADPEPPSSWGKLQSARTTRRRRHRRETNKTGNSIWHMHDFITDTSIQWRGSTWTFFPTHPPT